MREQADQSPHSLAHRWLIVSYWIARERIAKRPMIGAPRALLCKTCHRNILCLVTAAANPPKADVKPVVWSRTTSCFMVLIFYIMVPIWSLLHIVTLRRRSRQSFTASASERRRHAAYDY